MRRNTDIPDEQEQKKTSFFWEHCMPKVESEVSASIREKTFLKMQQGMHSQLQLPKKKNKTKRYTYTIAAASVAAAIVLFFSTTHFLRDISKQNNMRETVAMMDLMSVEETDDVVLVVSDLKKLQLTSDAQISYTAEGSMSVDSKEIISSDEIQEAEPNTNQTSYNQLIVPKGKRSQLLLSDGTKLWVNAGTKVIYPRVFADKKREIYIDGEVYLEVAHDASRPFYVNTDGFEVKVLGTSFDVHAYKDLGSSWVALVDGSVEIKDTQNKQIRMEPNELVSLQQNSITSKTTVHASDYKAWIDGVMVLDGTELKQLAERLSLLYGMDIVCDSSLDNEQIYGKLDLQDDLEGIIDYIKSMIPISVRKESKVIYLKRDQ